jgi:hypothetical protein
MPCVYKVPGHRMTQNKAGDRDDKCPEKRCEEFIYTEPKA